MVQGGWRKAGRAEDFAVGRLDPVNLGSLLLAVYRRQDGGLIVLEDRCPHRLAPLSAGQVEGDEVRCLYHGFRFAPDGRCSYAPGQGRPAEELKVRAFPVAERDGAVWVWTGEAAAADEVLIPAG